MRRIFFVLAAWLPSHAFAQEPPRPLFASDTPIDITISGPISDIASRAARSTQAHSGVLRAEGMDLPITVAARGLSRRRPEVCDFPPLRIRFTRPTPDQSIFAEQDSLKLVTHCKNETRFEKLMMREYAAYRMYNLVTPESFRVRLARIRYVNADSGKEFASRYGFFIEDIDHVADRLGRKEVSVPTTSWRDLSPGDSARLGLFQYLIANVDWAVRRGPRGSDCCHNMKMIGDESTSRQGLTPVPYDFDQSGWVDAPYAAPQIELGLNSVRKRLYRGLCQENHLIAAEVDRFRSARGAMGGVIAGLPLLNDREKRTMQGFLEDFFEDVEDSRSLGKVLDDCR